MDLITRRRAIESLGALLAAFSPKGKSAASTTARNRELAIQYSDVVFAFEFTPAEYRMWHANKLYGWSGRVGNKEDVAKFVDKKDTALEAGVKMGSSLNAFAGDREWYADQDHEWKDGLWRDANGYLLTYPWVRPPDPFPPEKGVICTNHPLFLKKKFEEVDLAMAGKPYCFHLDDPLGTATVLRGQSPGCFCRYCVAGFRQYLKRTTSPERLQSLSISDVDTFDYAARLKGRTRRQILIDELWLDFEDFQLEAAVSNVRRLIHRAREQRGEWIPVGANAPVAGHHIVFAPLLDFIAAEVGTDAVEKRFGAKPMLNYKIGESLGIAIAATGIYKDWVRLLIHDIPDLVRGWVAESYAMGGNFIVPHKEWGFVDFGQGETISTAYPGKPEVIGPAYKFVRDYPVLFDGYKPLAQVGVLYDYARTRRQMSGFELPQTPGVKPAQLHEICLELGTANIQFGMVVAGGGPFRHELTRQDLDQFEYVVVNDPVMVEGKQRSLLDELERNGRLVHWKGLESVKSRVKQMVAADPPGAVWVLPRKNPLRPDAPVICHVLNRAFDAKEEKLVRHRAVKVRLNKELFGDRDYWKCVLYMERTWPIELPVTTQGDVVEVSVPHLELWGVLQFG
jgi:hypothetical protein